MTRDDKNKRNSDLYSNALKQIKNIDYENYNLNEIYNSNIEKWLKLIKENSKRKYLLDIHNSVQIPHPEKILKLTKINQGPFDKQLLLFREILEILEKLDSVFISNIENYELVYKTGLHYKQIQENLINSFDSNITYELRLFFETVLKEIFDEKHNREKQALKYLYADFYEKMNLYISNFFDPILNTLSHYFVNTRLKEKNAVPDIKEHINLKINGKTENRVSNYLEIGKESIFLSYAYNDRFYSFLLFLEAKSCDKFLFVDWMLNNKENEVRILKARLHYFLKNSDKILFLKSIESELYINTSKNTKARNRDKQIRQWCSWELGIYHNLKNGNDNYTISRTEYYSLNRPTNDNIEEVKENILLSDFIKVDSIKKI